MPDLIIRNKNISQKGPQEKAVEYDHLQWNNTCDEYYDKWYYQIHSFKQLSNLKFSALTTIVKEMHNSMNKIKDDSDYTIMWL